MNIPEKFLQNQAFQNDLIAFDEIVPYRAFGKPDAPAVPKACEVLPDGTVNVSFYAPNANEVTATNFKTTVSLEKGEDGVFRGALKYEDPGFKQLSFSVDGNLVLNYMAPIGFGSSKPLNYVEVPDPECEFLLLKDVPHGSVTKEIFYSKITKQYEACLVYTPPEYMKSTESYPVLYLQHGGGENENSWVYQGKINYIMDNLLDKKEANPCVIVMGCGMVQVPDENGVRTVDYSRYNDILVEELIPFIEGKYRVKTDKWNRAYAGLSMGSLQCAKLVFNRLDLFCAAGLFTGYLWPQKDPATFPHEIFDDNEKFNRELKVLFRAMGDKETSIPLFQYEHEKLTEKGVNFIEKIYQGEHEWRVWRNAAHDFLKLIFR